MAYYNFLRLHRALKFGKTRRTPAMQAGLAKKRPSFRDVFTCRAAFFLSFLMVVVARYANGSQVCPVWALEGELLNNICLKKHQLITRIQAAGADGVISHRVVGENRPDSF